MSEVVTLLAIIEVDPFLNNGRVLSSCLELRLLSSTNEQVIAMTTPTNVVNH